MTGWVLVGAASAAYDIYAVATGKETMSSAFRKTWRHPRGRLACAAVVGVLIAHLLGEP